MRPLASGSPSPPPEAVRCLADVSTELADAFFAGAQDTLRALLADPDLLHGQPAEEPGRFGRRLLHADPENRFGIWVLTWPPGWRTPIHDHHCACAFGVYRGSVEEIFYAPGPAGTDVVESSRHLRAAGYIGGAPFERRLVHEMRNPGDVAAVSLHLYAYRPDRHADSIDRRFPRAPGAEEPP